MLKGEIIMPEKAKTETKEVQEQMIGMDHIKGCVNKVLTEFTNQEMGNRITQFNMQGLANILIGVIANPDALKQQMVKDEAPNK